MADNQLMEYKSKVCPACGARCDVSATYCRACSQSLPTEVSEDLPAFESVDNETAKEMIGRNAAYYLEKFKRVHGKSFFLQFNGAAFLFGTTWFFYRKMYKVAVLWRLFTLLLSFLLTLSLAFVFRADVEQYFVNRDAYVAYRNSGVEMYVWNEDGYLVDNEDYNHSYSVNYGKSKTKAKWIDFFCTAPIVVLNCLFTLTGNWFYRRKLEQDGQRQTRDKGGTSVAAAIIGPLILCVPALAVSVAFTVIPVIARLLEAVI